MVQMLATGAMTGPPKTSLVLGEPVNLKERARDR
jgi:hypothetical protein